MGTTNASSARARAGDRGHRGACARRLLRVVFTLKSRHADSETQVGPVAAADWISKVTWFCCIVYEHIYSIHFSSRYRIIVLFLLGRLVAVLLFWRGPPAVGRGHVDAFVSLASGQPFVFRPAARAGSPPPPWDGPTHLFCFMSWASPSAVVAMCFFLRRNCLRGDGGLTVATARFLSSGRGLPLWYFFEGPRERDFLCSNHSSRGESIP